MTHYKQQILACDFFTVGTLWLQTLYVLFYIELGKQCKNPSQNRLRWIC